MSYQDYLNSEGWKAKRAMILNMWGNRCALCNEGGELHLHHRTYERKGNEDPFGLIPLCKKHHEIFHGKEEDLWWQGATTTAQGIIKYVKDSFPLSDDLLEYLTLLYESYGGVWESK